MLSVCSGPQAVPPALPDAGRALALGVPTTIRSHGACVSFSLAPAQPLQHAPGASRGVASDLGPTHRASPVSQRHPRSRRRADSMGAVLIDAPASRAAPNTAIDGHAAAMEDLQRVLDRCEPLQANQPGEALSQSPGDELDLEFALGRDYSANQQRSTHTLAHAQQQNDFQEPLLPTSSSDQQPVQGALDDSSRAVAVGQCIGPMGARRLMRHLSACRSLAALQAACDAHLPTFNHLHVACAMNRLAKCRELGSPYHASAVLALLSTLEQLFIHNLPKYTAREVANAVWCWAKAGHEPQPATRTMFVAAITAQHGRLLTAPLAAPQAVANLAWGLATLRWQEPRVWACVAAAATALLARDSSSSAAAAPKGRHHPRQTLPAADGGAALAPVDVACLAWAFATAGTHTPELMRLLAGAAQAQLRDMCPQDLANVLWACATAGTAPPALFAAAEPVVRACARGFTSQGLGNVAWAYAAAGVPSTRVLSMVCDAAVARPAAFWPVHWSQLCWALCKAQQGRGDVLAAAVAAAVSQPHRWRARELCQLLGCVADAGGDWSRTFTTLSGVLASRITGTLSDRQAAPAQLRATFHDLSQLLWAHVRAGTYDASVCDLAVRACTAHPEEWSASPAALQTVMWCLGSLGHYDEQLFTLGAQRLTWALQDGGGGGNRSSGPSPQHVAGILVAMAGVRHVDVDALDASGNHFLGLCLHDPASVPTPTLINALWALAVLDHGHPRLLAAGLQLLAHRWRDATAQAQHRGLPGKAAYARGYQQERGRHQGFGKKQVAQLFHVCLWLQASGLAEADALLALVPDSLQAAGRSTWVNQAVDGRTVSGLQKAVHSALLALGVRSRLEHLTPDGLFSADCVVDGPKGRHVVVEVNGPVHYTCTTPRRQLGPKALRDRLLAARGYKVVNVPHWEWEAAMGDSARLAAYLAARLEAAGVPPPPGGWPGLPGLPS